MPEAAQALWNPSQEWIQSSHLQAFQNQAAERFQKPLPDYWALHRWSVEAPEDFWAFYLEYAQIPQSGTVSQVRSPDPMPHTRWFEGLELNYAEALLFPPKTAAEDLALIAVTERGDEALWSYGDLRQAVARARAALQREGVGPHDRVAAYMGNVPEAVVLFLACASLGAVFSSGSPDFGYETALARFGQIEPKVLVASDSYFYNGKRYDTVDVVQRLSADMPSVNKTIWVSYANEAPLTAAENSAKTGPAFELWQDWLGADVADLHCDPMPFDHPLYILYSSGTTGLPKAMVHRAGGALLTHHKEQHLHCNIQAKDRVYYFTTLGWMMWNWLVSALAQGAAIMLYEGAPSHPELQSTWELAARHKLGFFGTSARFIHACKDAGLQPKDWADLSALRSVASTGSPLSPQGFDWVYSALKADGNLHLASISGGTDIVSCFMLGVPTLPVYAGQIQAPGLGVDLACFSSEGEHLKDEPGELVCRQPLPCMPLRFWNDPDFERYKSAYFEHYPGVWRHGDLIEITPQGGIVVYGRSDATLNPGGVRIGTAEIYRPLEDIPYVLEAMAVGKKVDGDEEIWLFVVMAEAQELSDERIQALRQRIREKASPRHVPRRVFAVPALPRTRSGKSTEIAVSRLVNGQEIPNRSAMANPESLDAIAAVIDEA